MKKNEIRFDEPIRQNYVAIILMIYKRFKILIRGVWPILLVVFFKESSNIKEYVMMGLVAIVIISIVFAIIAYFRFYFSVKGDELVIQKGVLTKKFLNIPFDRIQTVNYEQNLVQQAFNVVGLKIDTAGSKGSEFEFEALDKPTANALRELILEKKRETVSAENGGEESVFEDKKEVILKLNLRDLFRVGVSQNHLRSFFLIIAFFGTIYQQLKDVGLEPDAMIGSVQEVDESNYKLAFLLLVPFFLLVSFLISIISTGLKYFNLKLERGYNGFKVTSGLFNRKEVAAVDNKIQMLSWKNNPLKRLLKINDVQFKQASSVEVNVKKSINIPGCTSEHIQNIKDFYFDEDAFDNMQSYTISRHFIYWRTLYIAFVPAAIGSLIIYLLGTGNLLLYLIPAFWFSWMTVASFVRHHKRTYALNSKVFESGKGMFGNMYSIMNLYKIQNVKIKSSIYQRRRGLADLQLYTAADSIRIPFIEIERARAMRDYLLYKVESSDLHWM